MEERFEPGEGGSVREASMASIVFGAGTSHTPMLNVAAEAWPLFERLDRQSPHLFKDGRQATYEELLALAPPSLQAELAPNTMARRHGEAMAAIALLHQELAAAALDAVTRRKSITTTSCRVCSSIAARRSQTSRTARASRRLVGRSGQRGRIARRRATTRIRRLGTIRCMPGLRPISLRPSTPTTHPTNPRRAAAIGSAGPSVRQSKTNPNRCALGLWRRAD